MIRVHTQNTGAFAFDCFEGSIVHAFRITMLICYGISIVTRFGRHKPDPKDCSIGRITEAIDANVVPLTYLTEMARNADVNKRIPCYWLGDIQHHLDEIVAFGNR